MHEDAAELQIESSDSCEKLQPVPRARPKHPGVNKVFNNNELGTLHVSLRQYSLNNFNNEKLTRRRLTASVYPDIES